MAKKRRLLFSVTRKDFDIQTFRAGGKGGQNQNKLETGVRIVHRESGAVGESRTHRTQGRNKREAFARLVTSEKFRTWQKKKTAEMLQDEHELRERVNRQVEVMMKPANLKVEVKRDGRWEPES